MMISPDTYKEGLAGMNVNELAARRDELVESVRRFESGDVGEGGFAMDPGPEVAYQVELLYLAKVCEALSEEYNRSVVWGD